jgi:hypothetical protein
MRFLKGTHYPHPSRGLGRGRYNMSDAARRARRRNLSKSHLRSDRESLVIKILIWQSCFDDGPRTSQPTNFTFPLSRFRPAQEVCCSAVPPQLLGPKLCPVAAWMR